MKTAPCPEVWAAVRTVAAGRVGATVFSDEILRPSPRFQVRLLRFLQDHTFERMGGEETLNVDGARDRGQPPRPCLKKWPWVVSVRISSIG